MVVWLLYVIGLLLLVLWVRVLLETVIVVFNIADTLTALKDKADSL